jgi:rhamnulokinase
MSSFYLACELGAETGRVMLGALENRALTVSELRRFEHLPTTEKGSLVWNMPHLLGEILEALREVGAQDEPVDSISCHSSVSDWLLFDSVDSLITPVYHHEDRRSELGMKKLLAKISADALYEETGVQTTPENALFQLVAESSRRLSRASHLLPLADGFNFLLGGEARAEVSLASRSQLYNPVAKAWSDRLVSALGLPPRLLPAVVPAGTVLGGLRREVADQTGLAETRVVASCSHEIAAALAGLPTPNAGWAYLWPGATTLLGTVVGEPFIGEASRLMNFSNEVGYGGSVCLHRQVMGVWIFEECRRFWGEQDRGLDPDVLMHLATSAPPFEALINPADPRFTTPGDMPLKIQAFCKETNQEVPRKPGPIVRCILESLALLYRKALLEIEYLTGRKVEQLLVLGGSSNGLLNHFIANAVQLPVIVAPAEAPSIGNVLVQALALGHVHSLGEAQDIVRKSIRMDAIRPHTAAWHAAFDRFAELSAA